MSFNGSGTFSINSTGQTVVSGTTISDTVFNALTADLATGLTNCITRDGQSPATADISLGSHKITNLSDGSSLTDAANIKNIQNGANWLTGVAGADTITASASPTPSSYVAGQTFRFVSVAANTGAATINISSLGAKTLSKQGATALSSGDIPSGAVVEIVFDGTNFQVINVKSSGYAASGANSDITSLSALSTPLSVAQGGTGAAIHTANSVMLGNGTSAFSEVAPSTSGNVLTSNGTTWTSATPAGVPTGTIISFGSSTPPSGYLACNGAAVSRATYATLFAAISTAYGVGDGSTTFNLPNFATGYAPVQGTPSGTATAGQMPSHTHTYSTFDANGSQSGIGTRAYAVTSGTTGAAGSGSNNLAAGIYTQMCIKY